MIDRNLNEIDRFFKPEPTTRLPSAKSVVGFKRLTDDAVLPTKAHATDSGWDLVAAEDVNVEPVATVVVKTGIAVQLPHGYEATVRPRSGVTAKTKLRVQLGTIDNGYGGEIGVIVDNIARDGMDVDYYSMYRCDFEWGAYQIRKGDRIAQLVITKLPTIEAVEITELGESERGGNGFGSTGV